MKAIILSPGDQRFLAGCLMVAGNVYADDAKAAGNDRIGDQFRQAQQAATLCRQIEEACKVEITI